MLIVLFTLFSLLLLKNEELVMANGLTARLKPTLKKLEEIVNEQREGN